MADLVIRPLVAGEQHLFDSLSDPGLVGRAAFARPTPTATTGPTGPGSRCADNTVVARAAWWAGPDDDARSSWTGSTSRPRTPLSNCCAPRRFGTEYSMPVPADWRTRPDVRAAVDARIAAATEAGLRLLVERYRYHWTPSCGLPARPDRLVYRLEPDDE